MVKVELKYNPYVLETKVYFNGQLPKINSQIEKFENKRLFVWSDKLLDILYSEMNGYDFDLDFSGTKADYEKIKYLIEKNHLNSEIRLNFVNRLEEAAKKCRRFNEMITWLKRSAIEEFHFPEFWEINQEYMIENNLLYVLVDKKVADFSIEDLDVNVESIDSISQLPENIGFYPVLLVLDADKEAEFRQNLLALLQRKDLIADQIFILISENVNLAYYIRLINDLGLKQPQFIHSIDSPLIYDYFENYVRIDFLFKALKILETQKDMTSSKLDQKFETMKQNNREIFEKISKLDKEIADIQSAIEQFENWHLVIYKNEFEKLYVQLNETITHWKSRTKQIRNDSEAEKMMKELQDLTEKSLFEFKNAANRLFDDKLSELMNIFSRLYKDSNIQDSFYVHSRNELIISKYEVNNFSEKLRVLRQERLVPKEDIFGLINRIVKNEQNKIPELVPDITYDLDKFREIACKETLPIAQNLLTDIENRLQSIQIYIVDEYKTHLSTILNEKLLEKANEANQLSVAEKHLQEKKDWLIEFSGQLSEIERG
ncbi:hypothetical protein [Enterococcus cecorum]|uniref:hypothetical protein n=1 Tax=Enterococcus cecorum TaxID=44008 RepID=UPI000DEBD3B5|nr:hypothetical protein [Enterococcus cecorum]RBR32801.1 hypothetical protein EB08_00145 [Enterococcus cecorum]RBR37474.1 hypothetical protein EB26_00462 [Enterococcus cecorum]RBR39258.1 hypothetical protein EB31_00144 [Enterococcus cecorum]